MKWTKEGLQFTITNDENCKDTIAFEKMLGFDREKVKEQVAEMGRCTKLMIMDSDGNIIDL